MNYAEFWPRYLGGHADPRTRALHYCGTLAALAALAWGALRGEWGWLVAALVVGLWPGLARARRLRA